MAGLVLLVGIGCGGTGPYPVEGKVLWADGSPAKELAGGMVAYDLITNDPKGKMSAYGEISSEGSYRLTTLKPGDGAMPGKHRVMVSGRAYPEALAHERPPGPPILDPRFYAFDTAKIEVTVEPKSNTIPIKVEKNKKR